ncbi:MAG: TIGR03000 domain-containing protein [Gemmataceae bacterium]
MLKQRLFVLAVAGLALLSLNRLVSAQEEQRRPIYLRVLVPAAATLTIDGTSTRQGGEDRLFMSPPVVVGKDFVYHLQVSWDENGKEVSHKRDVVVRSGGEEIVVDLRPTGSAPVVKKPPKDNGDKPKVTKKIEPDKEDKAPDVIFVPTPQDVVDRMLKEANPKKSDIVYDLGCGDGRIVVTAAKKYGCKSWGFDVDPQRIKESNANVKKNNVGDKATIVKKDIFTLDLSDVNVLTLYLLPELNVKLLPQIAKMKPGSRIVTHDFEIKGYKPDKVIDLKAKDDNGVESDHTIYVFTTPLKKE